MTNMIVKIASITLFVVVLVLVLLLLRNVLSWINSAKRKRITLILTPPIKTEINSQPTKQLFDALHGLSNSRSIRERILGYPKNIEIGILSDKESGLRFYVSIEAKNRSTIEKIFHAYSSEIKITVADDIVFNAKQIVDIKQGGHFAYPINTSSLLFDSDPISYLLGALSKLENEESVQIQMVLRPDSGRRAQALLGKLINNELLITKLNKRSNALSGSMRIVNSMLLGALDTVSDLSSTSRSKDKDILRTHKTNVAYGLKPARYISPFEQQLAQEVHDKLSQQFFKVSLRVLIDRSEKIEIESTVSVLKEWLQALSRPKYQKLVASKSYWSMQLRYRLWLAKHGMPNAVRCMYLSSEELAILYHFPHTLSDASENVIRSLSKTLPAPVTLKQSTQYDVVIGENIHQGSKTPIGLTAAERERHMYVVGGTGNGKTTMLLYSIVQDIKNGKGLAVIDPHGDLAETILTHIPGDRINDVIYLNPDDLEYPIGVNLLELKPNLEGDDLLREKDLVTESTISVLRKIFSDDDSGGHRIEYVLRNAIQTALTIEGANLFTIFKLLNDAKYRKSIVKTLEDEDLKNFWKNELGKAGEFQRVKMSAGITAKIGRFLFSASAKKMLEQEKSSINFEEIIDSGKILICNFSKGLLGEDTSMLFGTTILAKLQMASLRRARLAQTDRRPYYLYVDEFQNFATMSFVQMLSESRKYKLYLIMAEQSTSQQDQQRLVDIILANVGTVVCFRTGSPADERLLLPLFKPFINEGEIANLPSFNFYIRLGAVHSQEPTSGLTRLLDCTHSYLDSKIVVANSRIMYAKQHVLLSKTTEHKKVLTDKNKIMHAKKLQEPIT